MVNIFKIVWQLKRAEFLSRDQILKKQEKRFRKLLKHTLKHSKFYRDYYKKNGVNIDNPDEIKLSDLPTVNKQMVMDNYDDLVCCKDLKRKLIEKYITDPKCKGKKFLNKYHIIHTSGSSGKIGLFVYGKREWPLLIALAMTRVTKNRINLIRKPKLLFIGATDGHYAGISLAESAPTMLFDFMAVNINSPLEKLLKKVDKFKPESITGYASGAYLLAKHQLKGDININPTRIVCSGDTLTPTIKRKVKEAFGIDPVNFYASSESIGIAGDCDKNKLHLFDDWHCIELLDENGNPVKKGVAGHVVMTNLYNYTEPLIRYEMCDELILNEKPCSCGWSFPTVKGFAGRDEEFLWFELENGDDEFLHPVVLVEFFVPDLNKFQFLQVERNWLVMRAVISGDEEKVVKAIKKRMNEILAMKKLDKVVKFEVKIVDEISNDKLTGKFRLIYPL